MLKIQKGRQTCNSLKKSQSIYFKIVISETSIHIKGGRDGEGDGERGKEGGRGEIYPDANNTTIITY